MLIVFPRVSEKEACAETQPGRYSGIRCTRGSAFGRDHVASFLRANRQRRGAARPHHGIDVVLDEAGRLHSRTA